MNIPFYHLFHIAQHHKQTHQCGSVPYENGNLLITTIQSIKAKIILEIGTGLGYSTACMASADPNIRIHTIDKDHEHLALAKKEWEKANISSQITVFEGKAHTVIKDFTTSYDLIFFDGYTPQRKFFYDFERLLKNKRMLITANLFLNNVTGGKYLKELENKKKWQTSIIEGTAFSVKVS